MAINFKKINENREYYDMARHLSSAETSLKQAYMEIPNSNKFYIGAGNLYSTVYALSEIPDSGINKEDYAWLEDSTAITFDNMMPVMRTCKTKINELRIVLEKESAEIDKRYEKMEE